ncbi:MAG: hypothetical protein NTX33_19900 [Propionibacteriales bacterium]|nr:hypothetical protein [Propionibacteriales bacterium]
MTACGNDGGTPDAPNDALQNIVAEVEKANPKVAKEWWKHVDDIDDGIGTDGTIITDYSGEKLESYRTAVAICDAFLSAVETDPKDIYFVVRGDFRRPIKENVDGSIEYDEDRDHLAESHDGACQATPSYKDLASELRDEGLEVTTRLAQWEDADTPRF